MRQRVLSALLALSFLLALPGCAPGPDSPALDHAPDESRRLVVYTSHKEEVWQPIVKEFEERTGIWVDVVYGATSELLERLEQEKASPRADVMFGGGVESLAACQDCFVPYACAGAEHILERFRSPEQLWTPFSALPVVLIYNTKLVAPGQITQWGDLLDPELKGKIAFTDPAVSGSSYTELVTMLSALGGEAFCFMADEDVALQAKEQGTTRAVASMEKAARLYGLQERPLIFAVGNAPTALVRIYELIEEGLAAPALVIGVPVGFVNVVQSKELILTLEDTPYIVAGGRKGGSNVAAAICNALLYQIPV